MNKIRRGQLFLASFLFFLTGCSNSVKELEDKIYSRHLQRYVDLTVISTKMPEDKTSMNLLVWNDDGSLEKIQVKKIIDSLFQNNKVQPFEMVMVHGKKEEYGFSEITSQTGMPGSEAGKYNDFVINELYPFIKKRSKIRKFNTVVIGGSSLAGISAFDIAWHNADKIDRVAVFSGDFGYAGTIATDIPSSNPVLQSLQHSRKRPTLQYWLYASSSLSKIEMANTNSFLDILRKKNTVSADGIHFNATENNGDETSSFRVNFVSFLLWAFHKKL